MSDKVVACIQCTDVCSVCEVVLGENCCVEAILSALVRHEVHNAIDQTPAIHQLNPVDLASEKVEASFQCTVAYSVCAVLVVQN